VLAAAGFSPRAHRRSPLDAADADPWDIADEGLHAVLRLFQRCPPGDQLAAHYRGIVEEKLRQLAFGPSDPPPGRGGPRK
jgi:hypothetical protein